MNTSILSYPNRGPWGDASFPGNCSGWIIKELLKYYQPKLLVDPAEGSGTAGDVAREMGTRYKGFDLKDGFNVVTDAIEDKADLVFFHPPYHNMVRYSGKVWGNEKHPYDLSNCSSEKDYMFMLKLACYNIWEAVRRGGRLAILIGDIRRNGSYFSPQAEIQKFHLGKLEAILIKAQHNVKSNRKKYSGRFIPIMHEYLLIFRKH